MSALIVTLFFGGWQGPFLPPFIWFALKTAFFMMMFILIRASLPRPRYDGDVFRLESVPAADAAEPAGNRRGHFVQRSIRGE